MALCLSIGTAPAALAQVRPDQHRLMAAQQHALLRFSFLDGVWSGQAVTVMPNGKRQSIAQTERISPFLQGSVKLIEGHSYHPDGKARYAASGTISFNPANQVYVMHSYVQGHVGDYVLTPMAEGFRWEVPAGPMIVRYTAHIRDGVWHEVGERIEAGKEPVRFFEMKLLRTGDSSRPVEYAVAPK